MSVNLYHNSPKKQLGNTGEETETQKGKSFVSRAQVVKRRARNSAEWLPGLLPFFCEPL